jgi:hypothetical protein
VLYLQTVLVLGLLGLVVYLTIRSLTVPPTGQRAASAAGSWQVAHHDIDGCTHVVVEKVSDAGALLDEHRVAVVAVDDPAYDEKFLTAMATARSRKALFEAEQE